MEAKEIILKLKRAANPVDVFSNLDDWQKTFREYSKIVHPDVCKEDGSTDAFAKLSSFKEKLEKGEKIKDDAGVISYWAKYIEFVGEDKLLGTSLNNYTKLMAFKDKSSTHFQKYIPETAERISDNEMKYTFFRRAVPLVSLGVLKQEYVNFILSRMLEFAGWINQIGYCHAGINPDSIWVIPEDHGMQCVSFYHLKKEGEKLKTISGKYSQLYPSSVFTNKEANSSIDLELCKRTAIYLLGDKSGTGNSLRKTHNADFLNFVQKIHSEPIECYKEYREMLSKNFDTKQFHILNV